jgi:DNA-binding protein H-NS
MTADLKSMSVHDLIRLQMKVGSALKRKKGALAKAKARVEAIAKRHGVSMRELVERRGAVPRWQRRKATRKPVAKVEAKAKGKKLIKYAHPNGKDTWGGYGPRPAWVKEALKNGKALASFRIMSH